MDYQIKKLQESDITSLMKLEQEAFPLDQWSEELMRREFLDDQDRFRIIKNKNHVIAYIYFKISEKEGIIGSLAVTKRERKKGLARMLMEIAINSLIKQQISRIIIYTRENNKPMLSLSNKLGFKKIDEIDNYYPNNGKALVLALMI